MIDNKDAPEPPNVEIPLRSGSDSSAGSSRSNVVLEVTVRHDSEANVDGEPGDPIQREENATQKPDILDAADHSHHTDHEYEDVHSEELHDEDDNDHHTMALIHPDLISREVVTTPKSQFAEAECKVTWKKAARKVPVGETARLSSKPTLQLKASLGGNHNDNGITIIPSKMDMKTLRQAANKYVPFLTWFPELLAKEDRNAIFQSDFVAGCCVGIMAIPQSMSYASIAGLPYIYGMYAMLVSTFIYTFFGTSKQMALGPTAIMSIIVYDGLANVLNEDNCPAMITDPNTRPSELCEAEYVSAALLCSFWVGIINLAAGLVNLGSLVNFLAHPVIAGFTSGAGIIIGLSQIKDIVGTDVKKSKIIYETLYNIFSVADDWNWTVIAFGVSWIIMLGVLKCFAQKYERFKIVKSCGPLIVSILGIIICYAFPDLEKKKGVELVGNIPEGFPDFTLLKLDFSKTSSVIGGAISASVIGFLESIAIAKSIAAQHPGDEVEADNEMVALGMTNFIGSMFSAYPVTGSFSRSAVNNSSGARSQIAALWTCFIIALTLIVLTPIIYYLPKFALAAIVINSVRGLISFDEFWHLWKVKKNDAAIWALAFLGTLFLGITYGIGVAVLISVALVLRRTVRPQLTVLWRLPHTHVFADIKLTTTGILTPGVLCTRIGNMMYFANCAAIKDELKHLVHQYSQVDPVKYVVLSLSPVYSVDSSAIHVLKDLIEDLHLEGTEVTFACVNHRVMESFRRSHIIDLVGKFSFHETEFDACQACIGLNLPGKKRRYSASITHHSENHDELHVDAFGTHF